MGIINLDELKEQQQQLANNNKPEDNKNKTAVTNNDGPADSSDEDKATHITLSGPLSQIYTKALNLIYANENILEIKTVMSDDNDEDNDKKDLYLYCCDDKDVDLTDATDKLRIALDQGYKNVAIVTECNSNKITNNVVALENLARSLKVKMYFSKKMAMEAIRVSIENHK